MSVLMRHSIYIFNIINYYKGFLNTLELTTLSGLKVLIFNTFVISFLPELDIFCGNSNGTGV